MDRLVIRTKELEKNKNIILSIMDSDGLLLNSFWCPCNTLTLFEGDILSDKMLLRLLKEIDEYNNVLIADKKIHQWKV